MLSPAQLRGSLIPAVPVPFDAAGKIVESAQGDYAQWMAAQPVQGVALWAHTGRGLRLDESQRRGVLASWRKALNAPQFIVAAAGAPANLADSSQVISSAQSMARQAREGGADAVLTHPPVAFRGLPNQDGLVLDYHKAVAEAGLPLILFYLYEAAGGLSYGPDLLKQLLAIPGVLGIKMATLDSVMTFQDIAALMAKSAPDRVLVTGEDRFLGYSLVCGAEAALIGMGAACTSLQARLLSAHRKGQTEEFLRLCRLVDDLGRHTFLHPMEGYIQRMLWCLVHEGVISRAAAHDPWGPAVDPAEFEVIGDCLRRIQS